MAYGTLKVDNITYTSGGSDASTSVSGIVAIAAGNFNNVTATGTISGVTITGNTAGFTTVTGTTVTGATGNFQSGVFTSQVSGAVVAGPTHTGTTANFVAGNFTTSITGTTVTGTTANFVAGNFTTSITGTTVTGTTSNFSSGNYTGTLSGATVTGNVGQFTNISSVGGSFTSLTGTTVTGGTANFNNGNYTGTLTGVTISGTTINAQSGVFTTQVSGAGLQVGGSGVFVSGIRPSGFLSERTIIVSGTLASNSGISLGSGMSYYFLSGETSNATPNFRFDATTTLDSQMDVGSTVAATIILTPSATGYAGSMSIDGATANRTLRWQGGTAVTGGSVSGLDVYSYQIVKTASNTFAVFVNRTNFV